MTYLRKTISGSPASVTGLSHMAPLTLSAEASEPACDCGEVPETAALLNLYDHMEWHLEGLGHGFSTLWKFVILAEGELK